MLPKLVASNKPADVINASTKAFEKLPKIRDAIQALSVLRGVGPATASGKAVQKELFACGFFRSNIAYIIRSQLSV